MDSELEVVAAASVFIRRQVRFKKKEIKKAKNKQNARC